MRAIFPIKSLWFVVAATAITAITACERRALDNCADDSNPTSMQIPVAVDWTESGITPASRADQDYVHRVSIRFFPKDGSQPFDRYLEGNIFAGQIDVPLGSYSVIVFNESIDDLYWEDALYFSQTDSYTDFAANLLDENPSIYDFYIPTSSETLSKSAFKLASWSLDNFDVSANMENTPMYQALTKIKMRQLTFLTTVSVEATQLRSSMVMHSVVKGLTRKVMMASAEVVALPTTHIIRMRNVTWSEPTQTHGTIQGQFLTFGKHPDPQAAYTLDLDVILRSGERYAPTVPLHFDVKDQVTANTNKNVAIGVKIALPEVGDGVDIGDWDDEEISVL